MWFIVAVALQASAEEPADVPPTLVGAAAALDGLDQLVTSDPTRSRELVTGWYRSAAGEDKERVANLIRVVQSVPATTDDTTRRRLFLQALSPNADERSAAWAEASRLAAASAPPVTHPARAGGTGTVCFWRKPTFVGSMIPVEIRFDRARREDEQVLMLLWNGQVRCFSAPIGLNKLVTSTEAEHTIALDVSEGRVTWVRGWIGAGVIVGRPHLEITSDPSLEDRPPNLKLAPDHDLRDPEPWTALPGLPSEL